LYLDFVDAPSPSSDDTNVFAMFSDDDGATWSTPVQVNDDTSGNSQFFPRLAVDQTTGIVAMSWYDCRNDTGSGAGARDGIANDDTEFFTSFRADGGVTWVSNIQVSPAPSSAIANPNGGNEYGDSPGLAFFGGIIYPAWADNSASIFGNPDPP